MDFLTSDVPEICRAFQVKQSLYVIVGVLAAGMTASAAPVYTLTDIGDLPGGSDQSFAYGINDLGQVVGASETATGERGFLWQSGKLTDLGDLPGGTDRSDGRGINNSTQIAGLSTSSQNSRGFFWDGGTMTNVGALAGGNAPSFAFDINDAGQVVGRTNFGIGQAFVWESGVMTGLADLPGGLVGSAANAINGAGHIAGWSEAATGKRATLWSNGTVTDLGDLPGGSDQSLAFGINNNGDIVGTGNSASGTNGFVWSNGTMTSIGSLLPNTASGALAINDSGIVVGSSVQKAITWDSTNGLRDLNLHLDPVTGSGWTLTNAQDINDSGQIVGYGTHPNGSTRAFLLTPVPEPNQFVVLSLMWCVCVLFRRYS